MTHSDLIDSLAIQLHDPGRVVICGVGIGSRWLQGGHIPIPDVMMFKKSYTNPDVTIFEVKASRADFQSDINKGKYRKYLGISNRMFFALPAGMVQKEEVPVECGLWTWKKEKNSWSSRKAAQRRECDLNQIEWESIMFALHDNQIRFRDLSERIVADRNVELEHVAKNLHYEFGETIRKHRESVRKLKDLKDELAELLGCEASWTSIRYGIRKLKEDRGLTIDLDGVRSITLLLKEVVDGSLWYEEKDGIKIQGILDSLKRKKGGS